jgi:hypothetical protein
MKAQSFLSVFSLAIVSLFLTPIAQGQDKMFEEMLPDIEWGEGSVILNEGTEIKGSIRYNDKNGLVSFESGNDNRSFTARSILGFEFFDYAVNRQRIFYTIEYEDSKGNGKRPLFFEVLKDFKTFAVLAKMDPVGIKQKQNQGAAISNGVIGVGVGGGTTTKINQTETVYIMNSTGEIKPYLNITRKVVDRTLYDRSKIKNKIIDDSLLKEYFVEPGYSKMIQYAEGKNLNFDVKEDLLLILEYYQDVMN